jgi:hypothetical protein
MVKTMYDSMQAKGETPAGLQTTLSRRFEAYEWQRGKAWFCPGALSKTDAFYSLATRRASLSVATLSAATSCMRCTPPN